MSQKQVPCRPIVQELQALTVEERIAYENMIESEEWQQCTSFREQCRVIKQYLYNGRVMASLGRLGAMFGGKHCVEKQFRKIDRDDNGGASVGRPTLLTEEELNQTTAKISELHLEHHFPTFNEIAVIIEEETGKTLSNNQVRGIVYNHTDFTTATGIAMEEARLESKEEEIDAYYDLLIEELEGVDSKFLFNLDEVGQEEFGDAQEVTVVVPRSVTAGKVPIGFKRDKRYTGLVCIAPDGDNPPPLMIVTRKTIDSDIFHYIPKSCFDLAYQENGFMTKIIFKKWLESVFIPFVKRKKEKYEYEGKTVLLMDGLRAHKAAAEELQDVLEEEGIEVIFLVPHTSDQTQPLDLGIFSIQKSITQNQSKVPQGLKGQNARLYKILNGIFKALTPMNCCAAFRQAGLVPIEDFEEGSSFIEVRRGCARAVRHYSEEYLANVTAKTPAQINAEETRVTHEMVHAASKRIRIEL